MAFCERNLNLMYVRLISTAVALVLGSSGPATGQAATIEVRSVLHDPSKRDARFYVGKLMESKVPLNLAEEGLTSSQRVAVENGRLNLFASADPVKEASQASVAAGVNVPADASRVIAIILPAPEGTPPYRNLLVKDDAKSFPWGEGKAVNLTPVDFALEIGEHKVLIPGGKVTSVPKVAKVDEYSRSQTNFYDKGGEQWLVAAGRQMQFVDTLRRLFLIYKLPRAPAPDVRSIVDSYPIVTEKTP
jgi:hypothetical protein